MACALASVPMHFYLFYFMLFFRYAGGVGCGTRFPSHYVTALSAAPYVLPFSTL